VKALVSWNSNSCFPVPAPAALLLTDKAAVRPEHRFSSRAGTWSAARLANARTGEAGAANGRCAATRGPTLAFTSAEVSRAWCRGWLCPVPAARPCSLGLDLVAASGAGRGRRRGTRATAPVLAVLRLQESIRPTGSQRISLARWPRCDATCPNSAQSTSRELGGGAALLHEVRSHTVSRRRGSLRRRRARCLRNSAGAPLW
jgi:hypothetical protein